MLADSSSVTIPPLNGAGVLTRNNYWSAALTELGVGKERFDQALNLHRSARAGTASADDPNARSLVYVIQQLRLIQPARRLAELVAQRHSLTLADANAVRSRPHLETIRLIGREKCLRWLLVPFTPVGSTDIHFACADPEMENFANARQAVRDALPPGGKHIFLVAEIEDIQIAIGVNDRQLRVIAQTGYGEGGGADASAKMVEEDIAEAVRVGASDIHYVPVESGMLLQYRVDGELTEVRRLSTGQRDAYIAFAKGSSNRDEAGNPRLDGKNDRGLETSITVIPQQGAGVRIFAGRRIALRYQSTPSAWGENVVIRLIDQSFVLNLGLSNLGFRTPDYRLLSETFKSCRGLSLILGPTGSGKSTTLYCGIKEVDMQTQRVITIEDPIECVFPEGPVQWEVDGELNSYDKLLKASLRSDPDMIVAGEVRDSEDANRLVRAALSGHGCWTTLHTEDPFKAIYRLMSMKVDPAMLVDSLKVICAQTLGKKLCPHCKRPHPHAARYANEWSDTLRRNGLDEPTFYEANPAGCGHCSKGEKGRTVFAEVLLVDEVIREYIATAGTDGYRPAEALRRARANPQRRHITKGEDAILKCALGIVSPEEAQSAG